jgi:hypothetical protein
MLASENDILDRYLLAVKFWLPKAQQQDILAELAEDLHSQIEEREAALGRKLSEDDLAAILKRRGSPMRVASGYLPAQRLVDPAIVPLYRFVLKIVLLWIMLPLFAIGLIGPLFFSDHPGRVALLVCAEAFRAGFMAVGIVTTVFLMLDRFHFNAVDKWDPRTLPHVPASYETSARWHHLAGFIFATLAAAFWLSLFQFLWQRTEFSIPDGPHIILGAVWRYIYWWLPGLTLVGAASDLLSVLRPSLTRVRSWVHVGVDALMVIGVALLWRVDNWGAITGWTISPEDVAKVMTWVNLSGEITLLCFAIIPMIDGIVELRRLYRAKPAASAPILMTQ